MHISLVSLTVGLIGGVIYDQLFLYASEIILFMLCLGGVQFICHTVFIKRKREGEAFSFSLSLIIALFCFGFSLGAIRYQFTEPVTKLNCVSMCKFTGVVKETPVIQNAQQKVVVKIVDQDVSLVLLTLPLYPKFFTGDYLSVEGVTKEEGVHYGSFDYEKYLATQSIGSTLFFPKVEKISSEKSETAFVKSLINYKEKMLQVIDTYVTYPEAALVKGVLLGDRSLPSSMKEVFRTTGLSHIVVLSGFNITILIIAVLFIFRFLPLTLRIFLTLFCIAMFVVAVSGGVSVLRATLMASVALFALLLGKSYVSKQALFLSLFFIVLIEPRYILFDASLHLSFLATAGIIYFYPLYEFFVGEKMNYFHQVFGTTLAASLFTVPYVSYAFEQFSLYALLANMLVVPVIPVIMLFAVVLLLTTYLVPAASLFIGFFVSYISSYVVYISETISRFPYANISTSFSFTAMVLAYLFIFSTTLFITKKKSPLNSLKNETSHTKDGVITSPILTY